MEHSFLEGDDVKRISRNAGDADSLRWSINPSFDNYVRTQTGDGTVTVSAGASRDSDGFYHFPKLSGSSDPANLHFGGSVDYFAYLGVLSLRIAEPSLHFDRNVVRMYIVDDAAPAGTRLELATATNDAGLTGDVTLQFALTERGSELFFGKYHAGTPLAPLTVYLPSSPTLQSMVEGAF
jgi:Htaa